MHLVSSMLWPTAQGCVYSSERVMVFSSRASVHQQQQQQQMAAATDPLASLNHSTASTPSLFASRVNQRPEGP